jgi:Arc/MetJ-type ribon-helix-helix transcriptional regulator
VACSGSDDPSVFCLTGVSQHVSTETDASDGERMTKIDVRVPEALLETIEEEYERRGYASRSEAIRDALRSWANPPDRLSKETLDTLAESRTQRERGETQSLEDVADRYGVNLDEDAPQDNLPAGEQ